MCVHNDLFSLRVLMFWFVRENIVPDNLVFASFFLGGGVASLFHDFELLRYVQFSSFLCVNV